FKKKLGIIVVAGRDSQATRSSNDGRDDELQTTPADCPPQGRPSSPVRLVCVAIPHTRKAWGVVGGGEDQATCSSISGSNKQRRLTRATSPHKQPRQSSTRCGIPVIDLTGPEDSWETGVTSSEKLTSRKRNFDELSEGDGPSPSLDKPGEQPAGS